MQRTKQQALMFLLGAVLVGGAVGFSAAGYMGHEENAAAFASRSKFYDELGLSTGQRQTLDSLLTEQDCAIRTVLLPHDSALKSIRARFQAERDSVLTKPQLAKMEARRKEMLARREAEQPKEPKKTCGN
jgi:hypothetical protein